MSYPVAANSSTSTLAAGATFTGTGTESGQFDHVSVSLKVDRDCVLHLDQSSDGSAWDHTSTYAISSSRTPQYSFTTKVPLVARYWRVRVVMGESACTLLRLQSVAHSPSPVVAPMIGGAQAARSQDLALTPLVISSTPARLHSVVLNNTSAAWSHCKIYNLAVGITVGTTVPAMTLSCPPGATVIWQPPSGMQFSTAISAAATAEMDDTGTTAPSADLSIHATFSNQ